MPPSPDPLEHDRAVTLTETSPSTPEPGAPPPSSVALPPGPFPRLPITLRPDPDLLKYYFVRSFVFGPAFLIAMVPLYFRYASMRYHVDAEGITMCWGILIRREISLTYARIQDIHLSSGFVERWLGLARIQLQTASGSAAAEMTIEGLKEFEAIRDFLYSRMRGAREMPKALDASGGTATTTGISALTEALRDVTAEVRALREELSRQQQAGRES